MFVAPHCCPSLYVQLPLVTGLLAVGQNMDWKVGGLQNMDWKVGGLQTGTIFTQAHRATFLDSSAGELDRTHSQPCSLRLVIGLSIVPLIHWLIHSFIHS